MPVVGESAVAVVTPGEQLVSRASQSRHGETHPKSSTRLVVRLKKGKKEEAKQKGSVAGGGAASTTGGAAAAGSA